MQYDSFIIGQGIAGTTLALNLHLQGKKVKVFDLPDKNVCSSVAGGIFNPVTGKRQALTWKSKAFFNRLHVFYPEMENLLNEKFFHSNPVYRILSSIQDVNNWSSKISDPEFESFTDDKSIQSIPSNFYNNPFECLKINSGGWLDVNKYLKSAQQFFERHHAYSGVEFDIKAANIFENKVVYNEDEAQNVIFCTGINIVNPWDSLPLIPVKGEILTIQTKQALKGAIVVAGCFMSYEKADLYRVGSTYDWEDVRLTISEKGRKDIEENLQKFFISDYAVVDQKVGLRPTTRDRRPFLGKHKSHNNIFIFNGLGSKGICMAPLLADWMFDFIFNDKPLPKEVDIARIK